MSEVWGLLAKAQDNPQLITEAIATAIAEHKADATAHLGSGESLEAHKTSEVVDHLAGSLVPDKLQKSFFCNGGGSLVWQSLDALSAWSGHLGLSLGSFNIYNDNILNDTYSLTGGSYSTFQFSFARNFVWEAKIKTSGNSNHDIFFGPGDYDMVADGFTAGFIMHSGSYYAVVNDGLGAGFVETAITGVSGHGTHVYRIEYEAGVEARFYIDGVLKATVTENLPFDISYLVCVYGKVITTAFRTYLDFGPLTFFDYFVFG